MKAILVRLGSTFGALVVQEVTKIASKINAKTGIEKNTFRGRPTILEGTGLVARKEIRGEVIPPEGRRFGRKEEKNEERIEERRI